MVGDPRERWTPTMAENDGRGGKQERRRLYWKVREERKRALQEKYERLKPHLGEKGRRLWAANEVLAWGRGGVRAVAAAPKQEPQQTNAGGGTANGPQETQG